MHCNFAQKVRYKIDKKVHKNNRIGSNKSQIRVETLRDGLMKDRLIQPNYDYLLCSLNHWWESSFYYKPIKCNPKNVKANEEQNVFLILKGQYKFLFNK